MESDEMEKHLFIQGRIYGEPVVFVGDVLMNPHLNGRQGGLLRQSYPLIRPLINPCKITPMVSDSLARKSLVAVF